MSDFRPDGGIRPGDLPPVIVHLLVHHADIHFPVAALQVFHPFKYQIFGRNIKHVAGKIQAAVFGIILGVDFVDLPLEQGEYQLRPLPVEHQVTVVGNDGALQLRLAEVEDGNVFLAYPPNYWHN